MSALERLGMNPQTAEVNLLLVEDDELDIQGIKRAIGALKITNPLTVAHDGIEALEHLRGEGGKEKIASPCVIFLDIHMPRMSGLEFLDELRKDESLNDMRVFVLTVSNQDDDIYRAYKNDVDGYIVKSDPANSLNKALQLLNYSWTLVKTC